MMLMESWQSRCAGFRCMRLTAQRVLRAVATERSSAERGSPWSERLPAGRQVCERKGKAAVFAFAIY
jgi:hypothetical protein